MTDNFNDKDIEITAEELTENAADYVIYDMRAPTE